MATTKTKRTRKSLALRHQERACRLGRLDCQNADSKPMVIDGKRVDKIMSSSVNALLKLFAIAPLGALVYISCFIVLSVLFMYSYSLERWTVTGIFHNSWTGYTINPIESVVTIIALLPTIYALVFLFRRIEVTVKHP